MTSPVTSDPASVATGSRCRCRRASASKVSSVRSVPMERRLLERLQAAPGTGAVKGGQRPAERTLDGSERADCRRADHCVGGRQSGRLVALRNSVVEVSPQKKSGDSTGTPWRPLSSGGVHVVRKRRPNRRFAA
jgi:hypothetical protein